MNFFFDKNNDGSDEDEHPEEKFTVKKKSFFTPNKGRDAWLDLYIELVKNDVVNNLRKAKKLNISKEEEAAFYSLLHNEDIIIRPADKGSGIVVINKTDYIRKLETEMNESDSYISVAEDPTQSSLKAVKKLVNRMFKEGAISKEMQQYLIPKHSKAGRLKDNPKIHKEAGAVSRNCKRHRHTYREVSGSCGIRV